MSYNTCLTAVMDLTSAHNMGTDVFFIPSFIGSLADAVAFLSEFRLCISTLTICYHFQAAVFTKRNTAAFGFIDFTVFDDPSFGPVRTDHSLLISGRGSPLSSSLTDAETGESDISDSFTFWIEAVSSYTDLNIFFIGIFFMEVCINNCLIIGFILFCIPCIYREIRIP